MFADINNQAFQLISQLEKRILTPSQQIDESIPKIGEQAIIDLGEITDLKLTNSDPYGNTISIFQSINSHFVGLPEEKYTKFTELITLIHEIPTFYKRATFNFLERTAFGWLINSHISNRAEKTLTDYLLDEIDKDYKEYTFYFKIYPLILSAPFYIGDTEIVYLTDEFLTEEEIKFQQLNKPREEFDDVFKNFKNSGLIKVKEKGVQERAAEQALKHGELIIDILKCLLHEYSIYGQYAMPEIDHRVLNRKASSYLYNHESTEFSFAASISNNGPVVPIEIDGKQHQNFKKNKIQSFETFLKNRTESDLYFAILEAISDFSAVTSTINRHEKVVKLISFFEKVVIDKIKKGGNGETILKKKLMGKLLTREADIKLGIDLTGYFYRIRDAYLHHGAENRIDFKKLYQFQTIAFHFLHFLIRNREKYSSWDKFFEMLNQS